MASKNISYRSTTHAAHEIGIAVTTLRHYIDRGLIAPVRDSNGRRLFTEADINVIKKHRARRQKALAEQRAARREAPAVRARAESRNR